MQSRVRVAAPGWVQLPFRDAAVEATGSELSGSTAEGRRESSSERQTRIVEIFGPPGSGKTTLMLAVNDALRGSGSGTRLELSVRSGEAPGLPRDSRRGKIASGLSSILKREPVADELLRLMPVPGRLRSLRRRLYLTALAMHQPGLVLRDQGYLCAIAGLAIDSRRDDRAILRRALEAVRLPEIAVRIIVMPGLAQARLSRRLAEMGTMARRLERPASDNARLEAVFDRIEAELAALGRPTLSIAANTPEDLAAAARLVVDAIRAKDVFAWAGR